MTARRVQGCALALCLVLAACGERTSAPAPVTHMGVQASPAGMVTVQSGDTLWNIASRYRLPLRDIIALNGLVPPYKLSPGHRLTLPPPMDYRVGAHDTLYRVARMFDVPLSQLVKTNSLQSPYRLKTGQVLRIPSAVAPQETRDAPVVAQRPSAPAPVTSAALPPVAAPAPRGGQFDRVLGAWTQEGSAAKPAPSVTAKAKAPSPRKADVITASSRRPDFIWPAKGKIISSYGPKKDGLYNDGINIALPKGTPVAAAADGVVAYVGDALSSFGNLVLVRHSGEMVTAYAHLSSVRVKKGDRVGKGQTIGTAGATGNVDTSQLHFEIRKKSSTVDPKKYLG